MSIEQAKGEQEKSTLLQFLVRLSSSLSVALPRADQLVPSFSVVNLLKKGGKKNVFLARCAAS